MKNNLGATVIYLRSKNTQPAPASNGEVGLPRKGSPIGAIAYLVEDNVLEVAFSLQHAKHDTWNRERCARIVMDRLEKKRETCTKQHRRGDHVEEYETVPKYFRLTIDEPVLSTDEPQSTRPYDVLELIVNAANEGQIDVPPRLIKTIERMIVENTERINALKQGATEKAVLHSVRNLQSKGVSIDDILLHLDHLGVSRVPSMLGGEPASLAELANDSEEDETEDDSTVDVTVNAALAQ